MILDKLLMFSEAQAVTAGGASTDVIDLGNLSWEATRYITGAELAVDKMIEAGHADHACAIIESVHYLLQKI